MYQKLIDATMVYVFNSQQNFIFNNPVDKMIIKPMTSKKNELKLIDINFDFRKDSKCGDPDTDSRMLYDIQKLLWNKKLPNGELLDLNVVGNSSRLLLKTNLIGNLSSDRICPHFYGKYNGKFNSWISKKEGKEFQRVVRTIGGHMVFPAHRKDGFTINQARGVNRKVSDRFDLTLECVKRFYMDEQSPLYKTLKRYSNFLNLFVNFKGFINFFLLQDFLNDNGNVIFCIPFDDFKRDSLPENKFEYKSYRTKTIELINKRNLRILREIKSIHNNL